MALVNVKLDDKEELTLPANVADYLYILRQVAGGGFNVTDYKINVRNLMGDSIPYDSDGSVPDPTGGTSYFNTTDNEQRVYDGTDWYNTINRTKKVSLTASQIKGIGTTPITAIASPGVGRYIKILSADAWLDWGSVAFDDNDLDLTTSGSASPQISLNNLLDSIVDVNRSKNNNGASDMYLENQGVQVTGVDSTATGDSTVDIYITYEIITL
ncbi:MAG: hypothetical protein KUG64_11170 [Cycloclasticus sp.]|nr:hypothetical protein [Cycloclasticus sp.]